MVFENLFLCNLSYTPVRLIFDLLCRAEVTLGMEMSTKPGSDLLILESLLWTGAGTGREQPSSTCLPDLYWGRRQSSGLDGSTTIVIFDAISELKDDATFSFSSFSNQKQQKRIPIHERFYEFEFYFRKILTFLKN